MIEPIKIGGLTEFTRALKKLDADLPKAQRVAFNDAAKIVVDGAVPKIPRRSGAASRSVRARSTQSAVRIAAGGARVPYFPWLDFGGRTGPRRAVRRPFKRQGRYLWATLGERSDKVAEATKAALLDSARAAGLVVD